MTRALWTLVLAGVALAFGPGRAEDPEPAKGKKDPPRTLLLLAGIDKYDDAKIKPRARAEADARALFGLIKKNPYHPLDAKHATLLLGSGKGGERATKANFVKALKAVAAEAKEGDTVVLGFFGHGGPLGETGGRCYFLADSTFKGRAKDALTPDEVEAVLKGLKAKNLCVLLDVNFKGFVVDPKNAGSLDELSLGGSAYREFLGDDGSEEHRPKPGRALFLATNGLNPSLDLKDHGIFARVCLDGLKGGADNEGGDSDGLVTVDELTKYLAKELPKLARKHGKTQKEKEQDHFVLGGTGSHFVLCTNPKSRPKALERLKKFEGLVKSGDVKGEMVAEGRSLLERTPSLKKRRELRKAWQDFVDGQLTRAKFIDKRKDLLAEMKLRDKDARAFALKVLQAIEIVQEDYVKPVNAGEVVGWAVRELYDFVEEPIPADVQKKLKGVKTMKALALMQLLIDARVHLGKREDLEKGRDLTVALQRALHKLDPHTTYFDPETVAFTKTEIEGKFAGIGIQIRKDLATDQLLVATPIKGSPAYKAGIQAGDLITTVIRDVDSEGKKLEQPEEIATKGLSLSKAVKLIKGLPDTNVKLRIKREGVEKEFVKELKRAWIEVDSVLGYRRKSNDDWDFYLDEKKKIGYIRLTSFARYSFRDMEAVVKDLHKKGLKGLILDLRGNPGGLLDVAIKITDLFIDDGLIVSIRPRGGQAREAKFNGRHSGSYLDFPMVCLINGRSASGSEIVSAALQDHNRAYVIGERSYGKGSVQNIKDFGDGEIKLTTASFWRPNGKNLNKSSTKGRDSDEWGVIPDKSIKFTAKEKRALAEFQLDSEIIQAHAKRGKIKPKEFKDRHIEAALQYLRGEIKRAAKAPGKNKNG